MVSPEPPFTSLGAPWLSSSQSTWPRSGRLQELMASVIDFSPAAALVRGVVVLGSLKFAAGSCALTHPRA